MAITCTYKSKYGLETQELTPIRAIRKKCLDCCCWNQAEVKHCSITDCPLHGFRFGRDPGRKNKPWTEERRQKAADSLQKARISRRSPVLDAEGENEQTGIYPG